MFTGIDVDVDVEHPGMHGRCGEGQLGRGPCHCHPWGRGPYGCRGRGGRSGQGGRCQRRKAQAQAQADTAKEATTTDNQDKPQEEPMNDETTATKNDEQTTAPMVNILYYCGSMYVFVYFLLKYRK